MATARASCTRPGSTTRAGHRPGYSSSFTADHARDLPVPGEGYTFATLAAAQAEGDLRALAQRGRRIIRIPLGQDPARSLSGLAAAVRRG